VVVLAACLAATFTYYRRCRGRREDSDKHLNDILEMEAPTENFSSGSHSEKNDGGWDNKDSDDNRVSEFSPLRDNNYICEAGRTDDGDDESDESDDGFTNHTSRRLFFESQDTANYRAGCGIFRVT
jgi:hypothetical protein